ncbi:MAG: fasciclin domain-containing protein [Taibaiella sp.]|nr:fasciclin domain-containing protein [Taibaiella sp.]
MKKVLLLQAALVMLLAQSCSEATSQGEQSSTTEAQPATAEQPAASSDDPSQQDVVQVALGSQDHTTLVAAIKAADLVEPLRKSGPFTVFAPTNAAFDKLPAGTVDDLLKPENKDKLADILEYHVSVGVFNEDAMRDGQRIGQVNSQSITISKADGGTTINGTAKIVGTVRASNGVIYVVDEVLLPQQ